jgi:pyruvate oxidase
MGIVGDLNDIVPRLLTTLGQQPDRTDWHDLVTRTTQDWKSRITAEANQDTEPLEPQRIIKAIADHVAADAIISVDTGDHTLWFDRIFQAQNQDILISGNWRTLGYALPSAIAAKLEYPERQSVAIAGDGGAIQTLLELQTASQHNIAVTLIIMDNGWYAMEKTRMEAAHMDTLGSKLANPAFGKIAEACGGKAWLAGSVAELESALKQAILEQNRPTLIQVKTAMPMVPHTKP